MGGEIGGVDPGEDEEAGVIDDEVETLSSLFVIPSDPAVAQCGLPGGRVMSLRPWI
jgi:hypothetical protein